MDVGNISLQQIIMRTQPNKRSPAKPGGLSLAGESLQKLIQGCTSIEVLEHSNFLWSLLDNQSKYFPSLHSSDEDPNHYQ